MLVGIAFRRIGNLCLQGESRLLLSFALLPSPSVTFTQIYTYNVYINVPVLAVSIPHALRVTLRPFSHWSQVVFTMSITPPKGNGNASPFESVAKVYLLFGTYTKNMHFNIYLTFVQKYVNFIYIIHEIRAYCARSTKM